MKGRLARLTDFDVVGDTPYSQILLKADTINFRANSKLILSPSKDYPGPRTLTIIASKISIAGNAEITYDLDGLPGNDPDTSSPDQTSTAPSGSNGTSSQGEGNYPKADDGGPGKPGTRGVDGINGGHAPTLEIFVNEVAGSRLRINFKGQDGGKGGNGGNGGDGGNGQKGNKSVVDASWVGHDECKQEPGHGGNGGDGGDVGYPGKGGDGGNGGIVTVFTSKNFLAAVQSWDFNIQRGKGGAYGSPGHVGKKGIGGLQGDRQSPCPTRAEYHGNNGIDGRTMDQIDPKWKINFGGRDGIEGNYGCYEISVIPK